MSSRELSNPLQSLLATVARTAPRDTGESGRFKARLAGAGPAVAILCDCSSSMEERAGARTKASLLAEALDGLATDLPEVRLVAFGSTAAEVAAPPDLPAPAGGTALHLALDLAADP